MVPCFSGASQVALVVKNLSARARDIRRHGFDPWVQKIPWRRAWQPTPIFLPQDPLGRGAWWATVHRITSWTWLNPLSMYACTYKRMDLVEVMEFPLSSLKSWKMMLWKCCTQYASKFGKLSSSHRTGKGQFYSNPKERQCQRMLKLPHNCTHLKR